MELDQDGHVTAVVDLLLTIGYIDGLLHESEQAFIKQYLGRLVEHVATTPESVDAWRAHVDGVYERLSAEIAGIAAEVTAAGDDHYMQTRLKVRAVALFRAFNPSDQRVALEVFDTVMHTDGMVSQDEAELRDELLAYFHAEPRLVEAAMPEPPPDMLRIEPGPAPALAAMTHTVLDAVEHRYADDPEALRAQLNADYDLVFQAIMVWERQRARGNGLLAGVTDVRALPVGSRFLDGHVYVHRPEVPTELIVLGDLHGCYADLKAALLQSDFIERALRHQADPVNNPDVKLVLLGDYLDRGLYSFEGVLRAALQLLVTLPDHVILLRGNHELLVRAADTIVSAVIPAEAVPGIAGRAPLQVLEAYRHLFEHMPTSLLFDRTLFVHGGIPRSDTLDQRYRDLSSLDDAMVRFEMMWSDPVDTDFVPLELQHSSPRFNFGRDQFRTFMDRVGCHTMIRGHEQVDGGFQTVFDLGHHRMHTLFSAGGGDNSDLPIDSRYRHVTPAALTVRAGGGVAPTAWPWPLLYAPFNGPAHNGLYR